jgi:thiamine transport system ATP-binding protein
MLELQQINLSFGSQHVLHDINLTVQEGEIFCLLGPSGCGKTSLLRVIAGLETPDTGDVILAGQAINHIPVHQRGFGLMFQDFALFPHMTVTENIGFGLKMHHHPAIQQRVQAVLDLVGLREFAHRDVTQLSGGEKQRVALARSLAPEPQLLMLDEPLGSLDAALRTHLIGELRDIIKAAGVTAIYVTHDQQEALAIADRIGIMNAGCIEQIGQPEEVYRRPVTSFVAGFLGLNNIVPIEHQDDGRAHTPLGTFPANGDATALLFHPLGLQLADDDQAANLSGRVTERVFLGEFYRLTTQHADDLTLQFKLPASTPQMPQVGDVVKLYIEPDMIIPLVATGS